MYENIIIYVVGILASHFILKDLAINKQWKKSTKCFSISNLNVINQYSLDLIFSAILSSDFVVFN